MKSLAIYLFQSLFGGVGFVWLFIEAYCALAPSESEKPTFFVFLVCGLVVGLLWFFINGRWIAGFLRWSIELSSNAIDSRITLTFGDLFMQDGCKAIAVNDFFDSAVDNMHVSPTSLHGKMLCTFWGGKTADWDSQVEHELAGAPLVETASARPSPGKTKRYSLGTTVSVSIREHDFLCVALAKTDATSLEASTTSGDFHNAIRGLLQKARTACSGRPLNIPLLGSGLSRTGIKPNIIVDMIILAIFEESKISKITNQLRIVLPLELRNRIYLSNIKANWS